MYKNLDGIFFRFVTIHAFDGRTDRRTQRILIPRPRLHFMQRGKNRKAWRTPKIDTPGVPYAKK